MNDVIKKLKEIVGEKYVFSGSDINDDYAKDESLTVEPTLPAVLVKPDNAKEISDILKLANEKSVPVVPRGSGTGLSGGCIPTSDSILLSMERMNRIIEIDQENYTATVEPGVILSDFRKEVEGMGLYYPLSPEESSSLGGNVATNAGGMSTVKYGVTRNYVLGLEAVLPSGEIVKTGGKYVKVSTGYNLVQLIVGSEGTLAVVTKIILKLMPFPNSRIVMIAPFKTLSDAIGAIPAILQSGITPVTIEFIEKLGLMVMESYIGKKVPVDDRVRDEADAYLLIVIEGKSSEETFSDAELIGEVCMDNGAVEIYIPPTEKTGRELLDLRMKAHAAARDAGATDIMDIVVPRADIPEFASRIGKIAEKYGTIIAAAGHAGDGNIHLAVFEKDKERKEQIMRDVFKEGNELGGAISAEHGIGTEKRKYYHDLEDRVLLDLMKRIKAAFDPNNILNPGKIL